MHIDQLCTTSMCGFSAICGGGDDPTAAAGEAATAAATAEAAAAEATGEAATLGVVHKGGAP